MTHFFKLIFKKKLLAIVILFLLAFSLPAYSGGLSLVNVDVPSSYDVNLELGSETRLLLDAMPMNIRQQLDLFVDILFKEQLTPLLYDIDTIVANRVQDTARVADEILKNRLDQVSDILRDVINEFSKASVNVIDQVKQQLVIETANQVSRLRVEFMGDFARLIDCTIWSKYEQTKIDLETIKTKLAKGVMFWQKTPTCYQKLSISKGGVSNIRYTMVYEIKKCEVLSELNTQTPPRLVRGAYVDLIKWAKTMSCVSSNKSGNDYYYSDIMEFEKKYRAWSSVSR